MERIEEFRQLTSIRDAFSWSDEKKYAYRFCLACECRSCTRLATQEANRRRHVMNALHGLSDEDANVLLALEIQRTLHLRDAAPFPCVNCRCPRCTITISPRYISPSEI